MITFILNVCNLKRSQLAVLLGECENQKLSHIAEVLGELNDSTLIRKLDVFVER